MKNYFRVVGEMLSSLRNTVSSVSLFGASTYQLDTSKVDYEKTKGLYYNTEKDYKLGAAFAKPVIDIMVGFCGLPAVTSVDENAQAFLNDYIEENGSRFTSIIKNFFRDGDVYVRMYNLKEEDEALYPEKYASIKNYLIAPAWVTTVKDKDDVEEYIIKTPIKYQDEEGKTIDYTVIETITPTTIKKMYKGTNIPAGKVDEEYSNEWGFIPIVHFKNSEEADEVNGRSELENIEPFMRAYHDILLQSMQANKLHSVPKIKLKLENIAGFLKRNFTETELAAAKNGGHLKFQKDIYLLNTDEDMGFVEVKSATGDSKALLKLLFYCIVDASQTPEFAFGTAVSSSKASVGEQLVPLERKINMKRKTLEVYFQQMFRILLAMSKKTNTDVAGVKDYRVKFIWDDVSPKNEESTATVLKTVVDALVNAVDANIISLEAAIDYLSEFVPSMQKFQAKDEGSGEKQRILDGQAFLASADRNVADLVKEKANVEKTVKGSENIANKG